MSVEILLRHPPIIEEIIKVFPAVETTKGVIFSWGDRIYNPDNIFITPALHAHELVHGTRQTSDESAIVKWWQTYLDDMEFRLNEEILGHKAELAHQLKTIKDRNQRNKVLHQIAVRLSGPVYGNIISLTESKRRLNP